SDTVDLDYYSLDFLEGYLIRVLQCVILAFCSTLIGGTTLLTDRAISLYISLSLYLSFSSRSVSPTLPLRSGSSGSSTRSADSVGVDVIRQPSRSRIRRHTNRLSAVFQRGSAHNATATALPGLPGLPSHAWKESNDRISPGDASMTDDPAELSNQITAPGILKIFGSEICQGANYKSVLATTHSSAKELVKEALERYGLNKEEAESYVLCDSIGYVGDHQWKTECFRVVSDNEKPLLLQSLWKPREGLARRFEIQRRASVEEKRSRDKDTVTAGINAQARKLQKSRSRVTSALIERRSVYVTSTLERGVCGAWNQKDRVGRVCGSERGPGLCRSQSEADLSPQSTETQQRHQQNPTEPLSQKPSDDDNVTLYSIHPPQDCPYLLLLQGYSNRQVGHTVLHSLTPRVPHTH
ncbi:unnamed protein product, partial [Oncorhynchus mykiss]